MSQELALVGREPAELSEADCDAVINAVNKWMAKPHGVDYETMHALARDPVTMRFAFTLATKRAMAQAVLELHGMIELARSMR